MGPPFNVTPMLMGPICLLYQGRFKDPVRPCHSFISERKTISFRLKRSTKFRGRASPTGGAVRTHLAALYQFSAERKAAGPSHEIWFSRRLQRLDWLGSAAGAHRTLRLQNERRRRTLRNGSRRWTAAYRNQFISPAHRLPDFNTGLLTGPR